MPLPWAQEVRRAAVAKVTDHHGESCTLGDTEEQQPVPQGAPPSEAELTLEGLGTQPKGLQFGVPRILLGFVPICLDSPIVTIYLFGLPHKLYHQWSEWPLL